MTRRLLDNVTDEFERQLLQAGRSDRMPERSRAELLAYFDAAAPLPNGTEVIEPPTVGSPPPGTEAAASGTTSVLAGGITTGKGLLALASFGTAGALGAMLLWPQPPPPAEPRPVPAEVAPIAPPAPSATAPLPTVATSAPDTTDVAPPASPPAARPEPDRLRPTSPAPRSSLASELQAIEAARRALANQQPSSALRHLAQYRRSHPQGRLRAEAAVLRVEALAAGGNHTAAARLAQSFIDRHPSSPYVRRLQSLLNRLSGGAGSR